MCGIVAYIGPDQAYDFLIQGLKRLEYRGYDSAGIALLDGGMKVYKQHGKVQDLVDMIGDQNTAGTKGIGHTRWATHGEPNQINAHPHLSSAGDLAVIHNGIIENYATLKEALIKAGHEFKSDTDTEVLIHLIEEIRKNDNCSLFEAVRLALNEVIGAYAIVILSNTDPDILIGARKGSPLVVGIGNKPGEFYMASDATPIVEYTRKVTYLEDGEIALVQDGILIVKTIDNIQKTPYIHNLEIALEAIEKGGYEHFMLKEIFEQPKSIHDSFRGRIDSKTLKIEMRSLNEFEKQNQKPKTNNHYWLRHILARRFGWRIPF
jgi:glucosamine--fructose-6-phosphate aminotransferase (isomerizing)